MFSFFKKAELPFVSNADALWQSSEDSRVELHIRLEALKRFDAWYKTPYTEWEGERFRIFFPPITGTIYNVHDEATAKYLEPSAISDAINKEFERLMKEHEEFINPIPEKMKEIEEMVESLLKINEQIEEIY